MDATDLLIATSVVVRASMMPTEKRSEKGGGLN